MANSRKTAKKPTPVTEFPQPATAAAVADVPEEFQEPAEPPPQAAQPPPRNPLKKKAPAIPTEGDFFARVAAIPAKDWDSNRIYLYLYVLEPLCNLRQSGGKTYLNRYSGPVRDEHQIAQEFGSGRYRLMLSYNKVSPDESTEVARHEFEIYNPQYPPKVPKAAWVNDARNAKWEALLPKEAPAPAAAGTIVDAMRMYGDIRREVKEEFGEPEPAPQANSTADTLNIMKTAKDLFGTPATAPAKDPLEIALNLITMMNASKVENPAIALYQAELASVREELRESRKAAAVPATPPAAPKTFLEQLTEFKAIKDLLGGGSSSTEAVVHTGRTTTLDVIQTGLTKLFESPLAEGLGQFLSAKAQQMFTGGPQQQMNPQNGNPTQIQPAAMSFQQFLAQVVNPALLRSYGAGQTGSDFASWLYDGYPDRLKELQNFKVAGLQGAPAIVLGYKNTTHMWPALGSQGEAAFTQFVQEFCQWKPEGEEDDGILPGDPDDEPEGVEREAGPERI